MSKILSDDAPAYAEELAKITHDNHRELLSEVNRLQIDLSMTNQAIISLRKEMQAKDEYKQAQIQKLQEDFKKISVEWNQLRTEVAHLLEC